VQEDYSNLQKVRELKLRSKEEEFQTKTSTGQTTNQSNVG
jgi:hypothetical protein